MTRLERGEHLFLYGPRGSGKTTLLGELHARFLERGIPCGLSGVTSGLDDITQAFARAYPEIETAATSRRKARGRLWLAADRRAGVLLLDHVTRLSTAMIGYLRRLRGGIAGVALAVDVDAERDARRLRRWRPQVRSALAMPLASRARLRRLFRTGCADGGFPPLALPVERQILSAARGRPGWIAQCIGLMAHERYWRHGRLHVPVLCADTEIALRQGDLPLLPFGPPAPGSLGEEALVSEATPWRRAVGGGGR